VTQPCDKEERIQKLESSSNTLLERVDNLIKRIDRNTRVNTTLTITIISGLVVTVVGGLLVALIIGLVTFFIVRGGAL
jgi:hypothetical protein